MKTHKNNSKAADPAVQDSILSICDERARAYSHRIALSTYREEGWENWSYFQLRTQVVRLSSFLIEMGISAGDRIGILSESCPEWSFAFFAGVRAGTVVIPLDPHLPPQDLNELLRSVKPRLLFVSKAGNRCLEQIDWHGQGCRGVIMLGRKGTASAPSYMNCEPSLLRDPVHRTPDDTAIIVYTSGSSGQPKGVCITGKNLLFQADALSRSVEAQAGSRVLSILPLNHLFELCAGLLTVLWSGGEVCYSNSLMPGEIVQRLQDKPADRMFVVPVFLRLLRREIEARIARQGLLRRSMFRFAWKIAGVISSQPLRRALFYGIHRQLGGRLRYFISGGAPLPSDVEDFFARIGIPVFQGYGMTETSPVISLNSPKQHARRSVGRPLPGIQVRIGSSDDGQGEVLTRGPHVMLGYENDTAATAQIIDPDGWLHTGDLGFFDEAGYLYVTGRKKDLIVLGNGKKVSPLEVELALEKHPAIDQACVLATKVLKGSFEAGFEQVCAVVVPADDLSERSSETVKQAVATATRHLASYKWPSKVVVRPDPLPQTTTRKLKRHAIKAWVEQQGELLQ